jgi:hypothetical protein
MDKKRIGSRCDRNDKAGHCGGRFEGRRQDNDLCIQGKT